MSSVVDGFGVSVGGQACIVCPAGRESQEDGSVACSSCGAGSSSEPGLPCATCEVSTGREGTGSFVCARACVCAQGHVYMSGWSGIYMFEILTITFRSLTPPPAWFVRRRICQHIMQALRSGLGRTLSGCLRMRKVRVWQLHPEHKLD